MLPASFSEGDFRDQWPAEMLTSCPGMPSRCCRCSPAPASGSRAESETQEHERGSVLPDLHGEGPLPLVTQTQSRDTGGH